MTKYWLCCGSLDIKHMDSRARSCREREAGHPERVRFGTRDEHFNNTRNVKVKTKFEVGEEVMYQEKIHIISAINAYWWGVDELISYKLHGVSGWVYEDKLEVII